MELLRRLLRWLNGRPDKVMYIGGSDILPPPLSGAPAAVEAGEEGDVPEGEVAPSRLREGRVTGAVVE